MWPYRKWSAISPLLYVVLLLVLVTGLVGGSFILTHHMTQASRGTVVSFSGPGQLSATVSYDSNGIPLITANSYDAAVAGWGYVAADQRLFQLYDQFLWTGDGTLAAHFGAGPGGANTSSDMLFSTLDLINQADAAYSHSSAQTKEILQDYSEGINTWVASHPLPHEFEALGITSTSLGAWTPQDSMLAASVLSASLDLDNWVTKITYSALASSSPQLAAALIPTVPDTPSMFDAAGNLTSPAAFDAANSYDGTPLTSTNATKQASTLQVSKPMSRAQLARAVNSLQRAQNVVSALSSLAGGKASNNVAVEARYTATGHQALIANDDHLLVEAPNILFPTEIQIPGLSLSGVAIPGLPAYLSFLAVHAGGPTIATGVTTVNTDDADVRVETLRNVAPSSACPSGTQASIDNSWQCVSQRKFTITVADGQSVNMIVGSDSHGAIINPAFAGALDALGQLSLQTTSASTAWSIGGLVELPLQTTRNGLTSEMSDIGFGFNFLYGFNADIGYQMTGVVPLRSAANDIGIVPGDDPAYEWTGFASPSRLPRAYDPASGFLVTANNRIVPSDYPVYISDYYDTAFRAQEISATLQGMIATGHKITVGDLASLQLNVHSGAAAVTLPVLLSALKGTALPTAVATTAVDTVEKWDDNVTANSKAAAIYETWMGYLDVDLSSPDTGPLYEIYSNYVFINQQYEATYLQLVDPSLMTPQQRTAWVLQALVQTVGLLASNHISTWGDEHRLDPVHPFALSGTPYYDASYASAPATGDATGGASDTVNTGGWFPSIGDLALSASQLAAAGGPQTAFQQNAAAVTRDVWNPDTPSLSVGICLGGVDGEPGPDYNNLTPLWLAGQTVPFWPQ